MGKPKLAKALLLLVILIIGSPVSILGQDVDGLLALIQEGQIDSAEVLLTKLSFKYPGNPGVRYARAVMQTDALVAAGLFKDILRNHKSSPYVAGSLMYLGEYYYAQGLYAQSRELFMQLIRNHSDHPNIVNAVNLSLRAGIAARQMDGVYSDLAYIIEKFPDTAFDIPEELDLTRIPGRSRQAGQSGAETRSSAPLRALGSENTRSAPEPQGKYVLQAGAFGNYDNARRMADQIESIGYSTTIKERPSNRKTLYLIWVGDYATRTAAMSVADMLEAALGIQSFPVAIN